MKTLFTRQTIETFNGDAITKTEQYDTVITSLKTGTSVHVSFKQDADMRLAGKVEFSILCTPGFESPSGFMKIPDFMEISKKTGKTGIGDRITYESVSAVCKFNTIEVLLGDEGVCILDYRFGKPLITTGVKNIMPYDFKTLR